MGCDIHAFIEHKSKESNYWKNFGGQYKLMRDYAMFALMAGVRGEEAPVVETRGIPKDISWVTEMAYTMFVHDTPKGGETRYATHAQAGRWVKAKLSKVWKKSWITDPDAHDVSWLNLKEYKEVMTRRTGTWIDYHAVLETMKFLESQGEKTRLVFWFDS